MRRGLHRPPIWVNNNIFDWYIEAAGVLAREPFAEVYQNVRMLVIRVAYFVGTSDKFGFKLCFFFNEVNKVLLMELRLIRK